MGPTNLLSKYLHLIKLSPGDLELAGQLSDQKEDCNFKSCIINMRILFLSYVCFILALLTDRVSAQLRADLPPRGWNSYDSFSWVVSEEEFLRNADLVSKRLGSYGYEYVVVDYLWYRRKVKGARHDCLGFDVIDEWGRMIPDPGRWPSTQEGKGFTEVARKVHDMGLKFGIHVMRGISRQAVDANTLILDPVKGGPYMESGRQWRAKDIALTDRACAWMPHGFMSVDIDLGAGRAFLASLYNQYAEWGVDFVKHDCIFGDDLDIKEISLVSEVLKGLNRSILYSLSPGTSVTPAMSKDVSGLANMYRITGDDWDQWRDVAAHFDVSGDFSNAHMIGAEGLLGKSWPDLDMLPLGWLTDPGVNEGPHRASNLNIDEQRTQMTLWSMAKSPIMFGGDMRNLDESTFNIITNPTLLEINFYSSNNTEFPYITGREHLRSRNYVAWPLKQGLRDVKVSDTHVFGLTSCKESKANGWSVEIVDRDFEQICWKENSGTKGVPTLCLYKRKSLFSSDGGIANKQQYEGKFHLLANERMGFCLDASPKKKLTSKEFERGSFSPCKLDANQMWELHGNGTLIHSYSGLCAIMNQAQAVPYGIRSWIAAGRRGEIYVAFFNLNPKKTIISTTKSDLEKALPGRSLNSCSYLEVWSGKNLGPLKQSLSMAVKGHGCSLFVLNCA